ncbi:hypothetical protein E2C01_066911 [Portunus trituberculatus]|uniref:Uncharacterized protein n=1 Tax=Portunus trituberculatus TaxID=210409 RepID=A0A5B7HS77_PORTR|nr:hypothetical protein [Portunus trituberculatus]
MNVLFNVRLCISYRALPCLCNLFNTETHILP